MSAILKALAVLIVLVELGGLIVLWRLHRIWAAILTQTAALRSGAAQ
jgi:hypothetical protein